MDVPTLVIPYIMSQIEGMHNRRKIALRNIYSQRYNILKPQHRIPTWMGPSKLSESSEQMLDTALSSSVDVSRSLATLR